MMRVALPLHADAVVKSHLMRWPSFLVVHISIRRLKMPPSSWNYCIILVEDGTCRYSRSLYEWIQVPCITILCYSCSHLARAPPPQVHLCINAVSSKGKFQHSRSWGHSGGQSKNQYFSFESIWCAALFKLFVLVLWRCTKIPRIIIIISIQFMILGSFFQHAVYSSYLKHRPCSSQFKKLRAIQGHIAVILIRNMSRSASTLIDDDRST